MGVSDENLGVSDEHIGVSHENIASPMKFGGLWWKSGVSDDISGVYDKKICESPMENCVGLRS